MIYALPYSLMATAAKIYVNNKLAGSVDAQFSSCGQIPITQSSLRTGTNILRVVLSPSKPIGNFTDSSSCDLAVIGVSKGDIVSTNIGENCYVVARVTCNDFPSDLVATRPVKDEEEEGDEEDANVEPLPRIHCCATRSNGLWH